MTFEKILAKFPFQNDQISRAELAIILRELEKIFAKNILGDVVEFGCYKGETSLFLARLIEELNRERSAKGSADFAKQNVKLWLYDSFAGLPEKSANDEVYFGAEFQKGELFASKKAVLEKFRHANLPHPIVKKVWFSEIEETDLPEKICFAFFDGDFYESIESSFEKCAGIFAKNACVIVDDYANEKLPGARIAVDEWCKKKYANIKKMRVEKSLAIIELS